MPVDQKSHRKLAAILSADVVGYSRLMGEDEAATLGTLTACREVFAQLIALHQGRVVDTAGDSVLAMFDSVVEAVQCATEVQQTLQARNQTLPAARRMVFRVGVNLGDVIEHADGSIYGDGVNIAARLQALAEPGGICLSGTAYDHIKNKLPLDFDALGEKSVKNIAEPVRVYRMRSAAEGAAHRPPPCQQVYDVTRLAHVASGCGRCPGRGGRRSRRVAVRVPRWHIAGAGGRGHGTRSPVAR